MALDLLTAVHDVLTEPPPRSAPRVAAEVITRRSSARGSRPVTVRSRRTGLASPSQSRIKVPPGRRRSGSRGLRPALRLLLAGLVELIAYSLDLLVGDGTVLGLGNLDDFVEVVAFDSSTSDRV